MHTSPQVLLSRLIILPILVSPLFACQPRAALTPQPSITQSATPTATLPPTSTPSPTTTATSMPASTPTPTPFRPVLKNTPLPVVTEVISLSNLDRIVQIASWGLDASRGNDLAFSNDSQILYITIQSEGFQFWDVNTGIIVHELTRETGYSTAFRIGRTTFAISPDNAYAVVELGDPADIWDVANGQIIRSYDGCGTAVKHAEFSPNNEFLMMNNSGGAACLVSTKDWKDPLYLNFFLSNEYTDKINGIAFSPDSYHIALGTGTGYIDIFQLRGAHIVQTLTTGQPITSLAFSVDGSFLAASLEGSQVQVWDASIMGAYKALPMVDAGDTVNTISFSPSTGLLATGSDDNIIRLWDPITGTLLLELRGHVRPVHRLVFSPDGRYLASYGDEGTVRIWGVHPSYSLNP